MARSCLPRSRGIFVSPLPFAWTRTAEEILESLAIYR